MGGLRNAARSLASAFAVFSVVPMPRVAWEEGSQRYLFAFFPLVGVLVGALVWAWCALCAACGWSAWMQGLGVALLPVAATGGIHVDGLADVCDALGSHASPQRKREVMKDPHVGAFAVVGIVAHVLCAFALGCQLQPGAAAALAGAYVLARACSGLASLAVPAAGQGMLAGFAHAADVRANRVALACWAAAAAAWLVAWAHVPGAVAACVAAALACAARPFSLRQFEGFGGDVAGALLCVVELAVLACLALGGAA